jgi:hypothetical protein
MTEQRQCDQRPSMLAGSLYAPRAVRGISARTVVPTPTGLAQLLQRDPAHCR